MDRHERIRLLGFGVDSLRDVNDPDSKELQLLHDADGIRDVAGDARAVVHQEHIEGFRSLGRRSVSER